MTDLDRLLEEAQRADAATGRHDHPMVVSPSTIIELIERVKEAEKYKTDAEDFAAVVAALKTENGLFETRLRATEEVVEEMKREHGRHELTCSVCASVADYEEAVK